MMNVLKVSVLAFVLLFEAVSCTTLEETKTDTEIKQILIKESIDRYPGSCPCPDSVDRAGNLCGKRSAYSRPGGASPLCYDSDISDEMVGKYRKRADE